MKTEQFDAVLIAIQQDVPAAETVESAAARVRAQVFPARTHTAVLEGCAGFRELIPAYLARTLSSAKSLLLVDHTHECVECRQVLERQRSGNLRMLSRPKAVDPQVSPWTRWVIAAGVTVAVGLGAWAGVRNWMVPAGARASVQTVSGTLLQIADASSTPVFSGRELGERQLVRTTKDSLATLRLTDGSTVEMNERSQLYVTREVRGTTVHLDRGSVIVHAAKQRNGALYVKTPDAEVMVRGTIFSVLSGFKGSRISVVEGSVQVDHGGKSELLKPGGQATTSVSVEKTSVQDDIAWSRESAKYLAILGELSGLQKDIERIPAQGLRTTSRLLPLIPDNTVVYASIPNLGGTLAEIDRLFDERMRSSPVLAQWWTEQGQNGVQLRELVSKVKSVNTYLGDEIVIAVTSSASGNVSAPLILAEAKNSGLREYLNSEVLAMRSRGGKLGMEILASPADLIGPESGTSKVYLAGGIVAMSPLRDHLRHLSEKLSHVPTEASLNDSGFQSRIEAAYRGGVGWLFAVNLNHLGDRRAARQAAAATGMSGVSYLVVERKDVSGQVQNTATLGFRGDRRGMASWLAAPAPLSTLDFVSPDATVASSFAVKNPGALITELIAQGGEEIQKYLDEFQNETGVNLARDVAAPLGGELTFAIDGPMTPLPSWKVAVEVYAPDRLQWAFERIIDAVNRRPNPTMKLTLSKTVESGRTFYKVTPVGGPGADLGAEVDYVFLDGYLLAAANRNLLNSAIQNRSTGYTLARSEKFRALLPNGSNPNFSGVVYHNVGALVGPLVSRLQKADSASDDEKNSMGRLSANSAPGLIYAYADSDKISIAANGSLFGFGLDTLALPKVFQNMVRHAR